MNRRGFLLAAAATPFALRAPAPVRALVTADLESHVAVVDVTGARVVRRIATRPGPRSIERVGGTAVVAHTGVGAVGIVAGTAVRHVLDGFDEPRYTAAARDGRHAFVTDSGRAELVTVDVVRGTIVARLRLRLWPRHLSLAPDGRTLWVALGTASPALAVVDVSDPRAPRLLATRRPPFLAHDVGVAPSGRLWITGGETRTVSAQGRLLVADEAPQHVTFLGGRAFVTSGVDGTLRVYDERTARLLQATRVPVGSYNVQFAADVVLTPSLDAGTLCVLDLSGRVRERMHVSSSSHDACLAA